MCLFTNRSCYSACIRVLPLYPIDLPFFCSQPPKVTICGRHEMASERDIKINEAFLVLCLAYYVMKWVYHCRNWDAMGACFTSIFSIFSVMDCKDAFPAALCLYCCVTDKKIAVYEVYWHHQISSNDIVCSIINYQSSSILFFRQHTIFMELHSSPHPSAARCCCILVCALSFSFCMKSTNCFF